MHKVGVNDDTVKKLDDWAEWLGELCCTNDRGYSNLTTWKSPPNGRSDFDQLEIKLLIDDMMLLIDCVCVNGM